MFVYIVFPSFRLFDNITRDDVHYMHIILVSAILYQTFLSWISLLYGLKTLER